MKPRVLALCAGYGGLELALASVEDIELVAYAEYDDAPARIMAHHHPDVPNLRDVTKIDWHALLALGITIMTAGYPCQPFSHAGKRQGEDDPRHLWPHIAKGIGILRPALLIFENVRGHLSLGLDQVLLDLDALGYDVRVYLLRAADVGAAHGRARIFIFASDRRATEPMPRPTGAPVAVAADGQWWEPEQHFFGAEPFAGTLPGCSRLVRGYLYAEPPWAGRREPFPLLQTPVAAEGTKPSNTMGVARREATGQVFLTNQIVTLCGLDPSEALLIPTPTASDWKGATVTRRQPGQHRHQLDAFVEGGALGPPFPTPVADHSRGLPSAGTDFGSLANVAVSLLPTPRATDGTKGGPNQRGSSGDLMLPSAVHSAQWGDYGPAIVRWEAVVGRPAPAPTEANVEKWEAAKRRRLSSTLPAGMRGSIRFIVQGPTHRLSPRFVEWLMGLPDGWVCDVPDITRNQALKALGNGVVWQQAAAAYRAFLADSSKEKVA